MNCFFSKIAEKLNAGQLQAPQLLTSQCSSPVPCISDINLSSLDIDRKITLLKNNNATGPEGDITQILETILGTCLVPRRLSFDENVRAKEGGKETTGETSGRSCFQDGGKSNSGRICNF